MDTQTTNVIASSPNINGNIGSCEIKNNSYSVSSFYTRSTSVNSCTGQIINDTTYYDYSYIYYPIAFFVIVLSLLILLRTIFD